MIQQALALTLLLGTGACSRSDEEVTLPESVARLEFMVLSGQASMSKGWTLAGRYEVTQKEYGRDVSPGESDLPVTLISFHEAKEWCEARNMRLPRYRVWRYFANSGRLEEARVEEFERNGLSLGLRRALPVGVFERGRTKDGAYDFFGNVREWAFDETSNRYLACGGSFATRIADSVDPLHLLPEERAEDVGFRYFADAQTYLQEEVLSIWPDLNANQRALVGRHMQAWRDYWRISLADQMENDGAPQDFCQLLGQI